MDPAVSIPILTPIRPPALEFRSEYLRQYGLLPLDTDDTCLRVAVASDGDPDPDVLDDLRQSFGKELDLIPTDRAELEQAIRAAFAANESVVGLVRDLGGEPSTGAEDDQFADARDLASQPPVVRLVNLLVKEAFDVGASDIHLEATRSGLRVRVRVDGVLSPFPSPPRHLEHAVISRLKLLADLDIAERRIPQDGRIRIRLEARELDLRVSTVPTQFGESVVLRLLAQGGGCPSLTNLGMDPSCLAGMTDLARRSNGMILATGPTGSGKTTTLYAALALRPSATEKIITVEDPIEYLLDEMIQVPVHAKAGVTFATALRSLLRQDPDVIMVGEMRDRDTTSIATQAALTGHLVFSTLHTNDAVSAITRMIDLGVEPFLIAATLHGILAQRLVRKVCDGCRAQYQPDPILVSHFAGLGAPTQFQHGEGCSQCRGTGFRGRIGLFELLVVNQPLRHAIAARADREALDRLALAGGLRPLVADGWTKVERGITTIEEVARVLGN